MNSTHEIGLFKAEINSIIVAQFVHPPQGECESAVQYYTHLHLQASDN